MYYGGFTYTEAYNLPLDYRRWFLKRLVDELSPKPDGTPPSASRATHQNTADVRALQNRQRQTGPARTRRFT